MSRPPLDYETPPPEHPRAIRYWIAFGIAAMVGLVPANVIDDLIYHSRTGHRADGGATLISIAGVPLAAIVAALVRRKSRRAGWAVAAICGVVAAPITVAFLYAAF